MKIKFPLFILMAIGFQACQTPSSNATFWVGGIKSECNAGAGETVCLQVHKGADLENANWEHFYAPIQGFEFEDGYLQHIEVLEEKRENPPADASAISYKMVKVIDKQPDTRVTLNDIWACKSIAQIPIDTASQTPSIEMNLRKMMIMGTNGCNRFNGKIENITTSEIKLGAMAETKMMCMETKVPEAFNVAINNVSTYKREGLTLRFYDNQGNELLEFLKVD